MSTFRTISSFAGISLVIIYAIGSGIWVSTGDGWYQSLNAPSWQPPDWVFGVIWPYNFVVLGIASFLVSQRLTKTSIAVWLVFFAASVACALLWAYQFYQPHNLGIASIALSSAALLTIPLMAVAHQASLPIFLALLPYQGWVITASFLSWSYQKLN
jgi:benzodiazapine receptor